MHIYQRKCYVYKIRFILSCFHLSNLNRRHIILAIFLLAKYENCLMCLTLFFFHFYNIILFFLKCINKECNVLIACQFPIKFRHSCCTFKIFKYVYICIFLFCKTVFVYVMTKFIALSIFFNIYYYFCIISHRVC